MSRSIQTGDYVFISLPGYAETKYIIDRITGLNIYVYPEGQPSALSLITYDNVLQDWQISGATQRYNFRFETKSDLPTLTGLPEADFEILSYLDDASLASACLVDLYINSLCQNDYLS